MVNNCCHSFHIPVMGTGFTIDTPIKVAKFGISSVITIGDDELCESVRDFYSKLYNIPFDPVLRTSQNYKVKRITRFLNFTNSIIENQIQLIKKEEFDSGTDITKYFELLQDNTDLKKQYNLMLNTDDEIEKNKLKETLKSKIQPGKIDVNIMTKIDRDNYPETGDNQTDSKSCALIALEGYALSNLNSSIIFSAGFNDRLFNNISKFSDFFPDKNGFIKKKIVLKVSDFRSAEIQGYFLAKKGIWVSEYRIESGINCGGHVFISNGQLLGPILEEFKQKKNNTLKRFKEICNSALLKNEKNLIPSDISIKLTVQGGIGTAEENKFLFQFYNVDGTGWATPFLLVPEATTLDEDTIQLLRKSTSKDYYTSNISPLGVPFNTIRETGYRKSHNVNIKKMRIGSCCTKGHLALFNKEFSETPLCTASNTYQDKKVYSLKTIDIQEKEYDKSFRETVEKVCLCTSLAAPFYIKNNIEKPGYYFSEVCPGPNMAFFNRIYSLKEMVSHIYGRINLIENNIRPHMFINELKLSITFLKNNVSKEEKRFKKIKDNLLEGINYYYDIAPLLFENIDDNNRKRSFINNLDQLKKELTNL